MSEMSGITEPANERRVAATPTYKSTLVALGVVLVVYVVLLVCGLPQKWTSAQFVQHEEAEVAAATESLETIDVGQSVATEPEDGATTETSVAEIVKTKDHKSSSEKDSSSPGVPPLWTTAPFVILLLCIAILPLIPKVDRWWESNLRRFIVASVFGALTLGYYAFVCDFPIDLHWPAHKVVDPQVDGGFAMARTVFVNAILDEYVSFIVLLFALFSITGGIRIAGNMKATPLVNSIILAIGSAMASIVGTTGAAMLLIRLLLETNQKRKHKVHTIVFFIFCVCNVGGCLLPIGDPPLFLGYLRGVGFLWTLRLWTEWLFVCGVLITFYFLVDTFFYYPRESAEDKAFGDVQKTALKIHGLFPNVFCLIGVILAVMLLDPTQEFLTLFNVKTGVYPPMFMREFVQLLMVAISFLCGSNAVRKENDFNYRAIIEVAALFFGIFICMQAPLQILNAKGATIASAVDKYGSKIGLNQPKEFFWLSGSLSSVLDNAPTYVCFFETARAASNGELREARESGDDEKAQKIDAELKAGEKQSGVLIPLPLLRAVSLGSVFMGAMTYIGNGPNFMVKSIAEGYGAKTPSFFGYMAYSVCILLPVLILTSIIFL